MHAARRCLGLLVLIGSVLGGAPLSQAQEPSASETIDLSYVTPGAVAAIVAHPARVLGAPEMEMLPIEVFSAAGKKELGIDPLDVEQILVVVEPPGQAGPVEAGAVVRFRKPYQLGNVLPQLAEQTAPGTIDGRPYLQAQGPMAASLYMPDDQTLIVATESMLQKMVANAKAPAAGPLAGLLSATRVTADATALAVVEPVRPMLMGLAMMAPVPPPLEGLKKLPELVKAAKIELTVTGAPRGSLVLLAPDEAKAQELEKLLNELIDFGQQMAMAQMAEQMDDQDDPIQQAMAQYLTRVNRTLFDMLRPTRTGTVLSVTQGGERSMQMAVTGTAVAMLLPAVQAARSAARRAHSMNNLKQIALAMHNHHDMHKEFPAQAITGASGEPLLSWRVKLLPFLEAGDLYDQFRLDEPWDSEHNKQLLDQMPPTYARPNSAAGPGMTTYLAPIGEGTMWKPDKGTSFREIRDGTSNTIMIVEVDDEAAMPWTQPADWEYDPDNPLRELGSSQPGGFQAALADGSVRFIAAAIDPEMLKALLTMAGGEVVRHDY